MAKAKLSAMIKKAKMSLSEFCNNKIVLHNKCENECSTTITATTTPTTKLQNDFSF